MLCLETRRISPNNAKGL
nr:unnamed protein product [Callosobruchus analis]